MITYLIGLNLTLILLLGITLVKHRKKIRASEEQLALLERSIAEIQKDHPTLIHADLVFAKQLREVNVQLISMDNQLQELENKRDNDGGYQHALRILEMGGTQEEIIDSCHLSSAEAELLMNLQAYRSAMNTAPS